MLDDLIRRYYRALLEKGEEDVKIGDFIKMVELRRKLAPADSEQKKFWRMLDRIRKDTLNGKKQEAKKHRKKQ